MIKKIDIAGIRLDNYNVREMILKLEKKMEENTFCTIGEISMKNVLLAQENERVREAIDSLEHTLIVETGILEAANQVTFQRKREIEGNEFFFQFMKYLERSGKKIFLLGETEECLQMVFDILMEDYPKIKVVGIEATENCSVDWDAIINEINTASANVVISLLPSPTQEYFLLDYKDKISASLWYGMEMGKFTGKRKGIWGKIQRIARKRKLEKLVKCD